MNWQLKYNASVKVIIVDAHHPSVYKKGGLHTLLPTLDFYYYPGFQTIIPELEINERYKVFFVNADKNQYHIKLVYLLPNGKTGSIDVLMYNTQYGWIFGGFI